jgi:hypothetical protein
MTVLGRVEREHCYGAEVALGVANNIVVHFLRLESCSITFDPDLPVIHGQVPATCVVERA